ncbi:Tn3 family transposase [Rhizorhabdus argentea]|uniref:Tn3 family transposase n=1 Tax=Rhizorhabdus argentea TaxID=1387174 RepID=UPI003BF47C7F
MRPDFGLSPSREESARQRGTFERELQRVLNTRESVRDLQRTVHSGEIEVKHERRKEELTAISGALILLTNIVMALD